jgi:hypothetical protein
MILLFFLRNRFWTEKFCSGCEKEKASNKWIILLESGITNMLLYIDGVVGDQGNAV